MDDLASERRRWRALARRRPSEIPRPGPGQVSVWDFPRPPRVEPVADEVTVDCAGVRVAASRRALRVCETASPPSYYLPHGDVRMELLQASERSTFCEWKGISRYWDVRVGEQVSRDAAWSYPEPDPAYAALRDHLAFHAGRVDRCAVGGVVVVAQPGEYYGGWITPELLGPFKGEPGSEGW